MSNFYEVKKFIIISEDSTLNEIYSALSKSDGEIVFVTNKKNELIGTITDGDVRRYILKNEENFLNVRAEKMMNKDPKYVHIKDLKNMNDYNLIRYHVNYLPIVDDNKRIIKVIHISLNIQKEIQKHIKTLIMAGGKGTRLYPLTKIIPKPLVPYKEKTIIEKIMEQFIKSGFDDFVLSVNYKKELIKDYFSELSYNISYIEEKDFLGTAGSIYFLKDFNINNPFFLANCDVLLKENFYNILQFHNFEKSDITIVAVREKINVSYGVLQINNENDFIGIVEKPNYDFYINTGIYVLNPGIINLIKENEKLDMPQLIKRAKLENLKIKVYKSEEKMIDIGQWKYYKKLL